jgi:hypothetical protein
MIKTVTDLEGDSRAPSPRAEEFWSPFPLPVADMPGRAVPLSSGRPPPPLKGGLSDLIMHFIF